MKAVWFFNIMVAKGKWTKYGPYATKEECFNALMYVTFDVMRQHRWYRTSSNIWFEPVQAPADPQEEAQDQQ